MTKRMLIDATHVEETRVALIDDNNRLADYDYESKVRKQQKGSIFLAKVTRVEPSLQAAFVNFGGNRHGFLPFSEIHPDYYRIPIADREALLAEQEEELAAKAAEEEEAEEEAESAESEEDEDEDDDEVEEVGGDLAVDKENEQEDSGNKRDGRRGRGRGRGRKSSRNRSVETVGGDSYDDRPLRPSNRKNYKIQEVVKRGQIMLIQVSKEERGNKGAAVTTYLSLPGRYCVLMPNSPRAGGVSRKIANYKDRRRMREILDDLQVPQGMSVIMRTAGVARTKTEIKRDLDYLTRLWDNIRDLTLKSTAPALIHEEGNLIRRSIRDIYSRDVKEVLVSGDEGYKIARDFMKMLIPSHVRRVKQYKEEKIPLFHRYHVENQINEIGDTSVTLSSGGYIVINPTEALISVDVNSGRATKGRHIEETALKTNLESADEVARQLRLRDLGGLVVIDFIDMEDRRNNRKVENRLKAALSNDRARIQVGRISSFGLLELSRQRLNPSLTEAQYEKCPHCKGAGVIRTTDSAAIMALRALEDEGIKGRAEKVILHVPNEIAIYILNNKRDMVEDVERRYGFTVEVAVDEALAPDNYKVEVEALLEAPQEEEKEKKSEDEDADQDKRRQRGGRRRGRRGGRRRGNRDQRSSNGQDENVQDKGDDTAQDAGDAAEKPSEDKKADQKQDTAKDEKKSRRPARKPAKKDEAPAEEAQADKDKKEDKPARSSGRGRGRGRGRAASDKEADTGKNQEVKAETKQKSKPEPKAETKAKPKTKPKAEEKNPAPAAKSPQASNDAQPARDYEKVNEPPPKKKKGWWSKG